VPVLGIGIADAWQDCGLGQKLMSILIDDARQLDRNGISLTTMLDNDRGYHIYLKMGFIDRGLVTHGNGLTERSLFLPLKPGATPPDPA
jgi:ribosomal protein S18 acetylase RimI-like enzyme